MTDSQYKLASINKKIIIAAARKALMAADSQYHAWPSKQQENFRAGMSENSRIKTQQVIIESLLGIRFNDLNIDNLSVEESNTINWANLLTSGIGEDYIQLSDSFAEGKTLLDYSTLYDYDYADHVFQQQAKKPDNPDYQSADYYAIRHPHWVRLLINNNFYYATFTSLATQLMDETEEAGNDYIQQLIPHEYREGKDNGKSVNGHSLWDIQINANGMEMQLEELQTRWIRYLNNLWPRLSSNCCQLPPAVYALTRDDDEAPHIHYIFNNELTIKKIRWKHFVADCKPLIGRFSETKKNIGEEIDHAKAFIIENYRDIMANGEPDAES